MNYITFLKLVFLHKQTPLGQTKRNVFHQLALFKASYLSQSVYSQPNDVHSMEGWPGSI